jgi:1-acyl-sn-glycerol-3-phosphate acyltransferase
MSITNLQFVSLPKYTFTGYVNAYNEVRDVLLRLFKMIVVKFIFGIKIMCPQRPLFPDGPFILAANHSSHVDTIAILSSLPSEVRKRTFVAAAKDYFFNNFRFAWARYLFNLIPADRRGGLLSLRRTVSSVVQKKGAVVMFPEGTRSRDGNIKPFKQGLGYVASTLNIPVLPVYISGGCAIMNANQFFPCSGEITVHFGSIMYPDRSDPDIFTHAIEDTIRDIQSRVKLNVGLI